MKDTAPALVKEPEKFSIRRSWKKTAAAVSTASLAAFCFASSAMAQASDITDLFTEVNISGAKADTKAFMILLIGIGLLFFGRRLLRRLGVSI